MQIDINDIIVWNPATRTLYEISELNPTWNGSAIQLNIPEPMMPLHQFQDKMKAQGVSPRRSGKIMPMSNTQYRRAAKPKRKLSKWQKFVKANSKKKQFIYQSGPKKGKLNLKKMGIAYRRQNK